MGAFLHSRNNNAKLTWDDVKEGFNCETKFLAPIKRSPDGGRICRQGLESLLSQGRLTEPPATHHAKYSDQNCDLTLMLTQISFTEHKKGHYIWTLNTKMYVEHKYLLFILYIINAQVSIKFAFEILKNWDAIHHHNTYNNCIPTLAI
jgi:hypothetical protein